MTGTVTLTCPQCGGEFTRYPSQVKWRGARFCSARCRQEGSKPKQRRCTWCGAPFTPPNPGTLGRGKFCTRKCWSEHQAAERTRQVTLTCSECSVEFTRPAAWVKKSRVHYCSMTCSGRARHRPGSTAYRGPGWRRLAERIRERDGHRCVRCGAEAAGGRGKHHVDHIVPWVLLAHDEALANDPENLATLCTSCHGRKTSHVEPRLLRGDMLSLLEFYDETVMVAAVNRLAAAFADG